MTDHPNVVGQGDLEWGEQSHGQRFGYRRKQLGATAGGRRVGCSLYEVPPGRAAFPRHYHLANEEAIYVLEGSGTLRIGRRGEEVEVSEGDYVALPVGADWSHQLLNTSEAKLRYLCFSTMVEPDVMIYPDSGRSASSAGPLQGDRRRRGPSPGSCGGTPRWATTTARSRPFDPLGPPRQPGRSPQRSSRQGAWRPFPHNRQSPLRSRCRVDEGRSKKVAGRRELLRTP